MTDSTVLTWLVWLLGCQVVAGMSQAVLPRKEPRRDFEMVQPAQRFQQIPSLAAVRAAPMAGVLHLQAAVHHDMQSGRLAVARDLLMPQA